MPDPKNPFTLAKAGAGLLATGNYLYNVYKNSGKTPNIGQYGTQSLSRIPDKYLTRSAQMAKKSYSYSPLKNKYRKKKIRYLRKKFQKKKKYKTKKFKKFLNKVQASTNPYTIYNTEDARNIVSPYKPNTGNSALTSFDIGLNRWAVSGAGNAGIWDATQDDISFAIAQATQGQITTQSGAMNYAQDLYIDKMNATVTMRNNSNIGVIVELYWVAPRKGQGGNPAANIDTLIEDRMKAAMNQSYNPPVVDSFENIGYNESLFDYPILCSRFKMKKVKRFLLYPGSTKFFKMACPITGVSHKISNISMRTSDPRFHRALVAVTKGLPVHSNETTNWTSGPVAYGPYKIDCIISRKIKLRMVDERLQDDNRATSGSRIISIPFQNAEIQPAVNPANVVVDA